MSFTFINQLPSPEEVKRDYPLSPELAKLKAARDAQIADVLSGKDDRFLLVFAESVGHGGTSFLKNGHKESDRHNVQIA